MEFIKTMKKREFIEMGLKALATFLAAFLAIILMEGMIYGIRLDSLKNKSTSMSTNNNNSIIYIVDDGDGYYLIAHNTEFDLWASRTPSYSKEEAFEEYKNYTIVERAPNAFELSITPVHYIVITLFVSAVAGFFVYKFIALSKEYKRIEENFEKTGTIELG